MIFTMKRAVFFFLGVCLLFVGVSLSAQESDAENPQIQLLTIPIQKVYEHRLGFRVVYNRSDLYPAEVFIPGRWFTQAGGAGEVYFSAHPSVPYMTVIWVDGEFSHVRLYLHERKEDRSWGALPSDADYRDDFAVETLELEL